jgi:hypothetical protein
LGLWFVDFWENMDKELSIPSLVLFIKEDRIVVIEMHKEKNALRA